MANQTENKTENRTVKNFVMLEGWLKDNTLEVTVTSNQKNAIMGQLIIAVSETEEYRIRLFAAETYGNGTANPQYANLKLLLPENTRTIKTWLEANEGATFDQAKNEASKVWATGGFDVYDRKEESGDVHTSVTIQGNRAGFKKEGSLAKPFAPKATFDCEGYVHKMTDEMNGDTETGRLIVSLLIPDFYNQVVKPVDLVASSELRDPILSAWSIGDTVSCKGILSNVRKEVAPQRAARTSILGHTEILEPTFTFVNERIILEPFQPLVPEDVKYLKPEEIKSFLVNREKLLSELPIAAQNDNRKPIAGVPSGGAAPAASTKGFEI